MNGFLLNGKRKVSFSLSSQIFDLSALMGALMTFCEVINIVRTTTQQKTVTALKCGESYPIIKLICKSFLTFNGVKISMGA